MSATMQGFIWLGMGMCVLHSAMFSGLNLAFFGLSRLQLEIEVATGNLAAANVLQLRGDGSIFEARACVGQEMGDHHRSSWRACVRTGYRCIFTGCMV